MTVESVPITIPMKTGIRRVPLSPKEEYVREKRRQPPSIPKNPAIYVDIIEKWDYYESPLNGIKGL